MIATVLRLDPERPNPAHALDGGITVPANIDCPRPAASEVLR